MFIFALSMPTPCRYTWIVSLLTKKWRASDFGQLIIGWDTT